LNLLYVCDATVACVAPLGIVLAPEELFLTIVQRLLLLQVRVLHLLTSFEQFSVTLVLQQVVLHMAAEEILEQLTLLRHKCTCSRDHLAQVLVHCVLILATRHPVELTELLDELVHGKHGSRQGLTLVVDVLGALDDLIIQDLVRVDKICHFAAEDSAVRDHLGWHSALHGQHVFHLAHIFLFLGRLCRLRKLLCVIILQPVTEVLV